MKIFLRVALLASFVPVTSAQTAQPAVLKAADLQADAAILRSAYEQLHPGLYRYSTREEMDADFTALRDKLGHDQSLQDAFLVFSEFAAKVRCGHTQLNPFNQNKTVVEALFKSQTRVPFYFTWLGGHMIVTRDFTPDRVLPAGTEIVQLNGVPAATVLAKLLPITRADGANESKRVAQLAVTGDSTYETFDLFYPLLFPQAGATDTLLVLRPQRSGLQFQGLIAKARTPERLTVTALTYEQRIAPIKEREERRKGGDAALFDWQYLPEGTAVLRMPTWALYNSKWNWKQWLNEHLDEAAQRNAPALILDLRGNEGGDDVGNEILPHLIDQPMPLSTMRRLVRYRKVPDALVPYLETWDKSFRDWGTAAVDLPAPWPTAPAGVTYLKLTRFDDDASGDVIQPRGKRFHGKVFVLIDATNSSATFQFAQNVQTHHLGTLVGQPTGGSQRGINGGAFFFLKLPHSGLELDLPLVGTFPPAPAPDQGVTPDVAVTPTAADIAAGRDPGLAAALRLVK